MIFPQLVHEDLGCASYLVGDEHAGVAAVLDPKIDVDAYLRLARFPGVEIDHVLETQTHADHVSGHGRLRAATAATIHVHRDAGAGYHDMHGLPRSSTPERPVAAICASGQHSALSPSLLQRAGGARVIHLVDGGVGTWEAAGWPVER